MAFIPILRFVESNSLDVFQPRIIGDSFRHLDAVIDSLVSSGIQLQCRTSNLQEAQVSFICSYVAGKETFPETYMLCNSQECTWHTLCVRWESKVTGIAPLLKLTAHHFTTPTTFRLVDCLQLLNGVSILIVEKKLLIGRIIKTTIHQQLSWIRT